MWIFHLTLGLVVNLINIPFDKGANKIGSCNSPKIFRPYLDFLEINKNINIDTNTFITNILEDGYNNILYTLKENIFPIIIGGDHTIAISSIYAANDYSIYQNKSLGVLWCDAHADFNTIYTSPSKNLHGMPVAVLCGHTLSNLKYGSDLRPNQFAYFGLRDIDCLELNRIQEYNMKVLEDEKELDQWIKNYECIHVSFDIDCLDPKVSKSVNTLVDNGKTSLQMKKVFNRIKISKKLISLDIVEYNNQNNDNKDIKKIISIIKKLF